MMLCPTCGNPSNRTQQTCDFCSGDLASETGLVLKKMIVHKSVNIEQGRPLVESALKRMKNEVDQAHRQGIKVLTLIHGYGSSGKGGKIRIEGRKLLDFLCQEEEVRNVIYGENFHKRSGVGKSLVRQYPELKELCRTDFNNPGITIVTF